MSAECTWTEMPHGDFRKYLQENIRQQECRQPNVSARNAQQRNPVSSVWRHRETVEKAKSMGRGFVLFLAVVSVAVLFCCVNYLQLKSDLTGKMKTVAALETELSQVKEDNNAYEVR